MFYQPDLYASGNGCAIETVNIFFNKYKHLINFQKNECILDVGTGDGQTTASAILPYLPKDFKEIILSDISEVMLDYAKTRDAFSKMLFTQLNIEAKTIPEHFKNRFNHITHMHVFHWLKDTRQALHNMYDMLKPGGAIFGIFFLETPQDEVFYNFKQHPKWCKYDHFCSQFYKNSQVSQIYRRYLEECGFVNYCFNPEDYIYDFCNEEEFKNLFIAVNIFKKTIPKQYLGEYLEEYLQSLKSIGSFCYKNSDNGETPTLQMKMKLAVIYAEKPVI